MITLEPLLSAPFGMQLHVVAALSSIVLGPVAMLRRSRDIWHKVAGRAWVGAMAVTALTSFWINEARVVGPFGPIHLLSILTLWSLFEGVRAARAGRIDVHRKAMRTTYFWALGVAGLFTLLPGRRMSEVLFGSAPVVGFAVAAVCVGVGLAYYIRADRRADRSAGA